jgi:hypothetical protein
VSAKQETLRVQFQPTVIEGRIKGDSSKLERRNGKPTITVDNSVKLGHMISGGGFHVPVSLEGDVARFEIANIVPGSVDLTAGGRETHLDVRQSVRGLVIDLDAPAQTQPQYATRKVTIRLVPPEGWPAPSGTIRTDYVHPGRESSYQYRVTKVTDGQATVEVALPASGSGKMLCNALEVPGYWFDERNGISVPPGEEPMVLEIPVQPAGAVFGTVLAADGSPAEHFNATVIVVKPAEKGPRFGLQSQNGSADGRFVIGGLGLGGVYRVMIGDDRTDSRLVSEEFTLDRATPTYELKLRFAEGITLEATVLGLDGQPRSGVEVSLNCETSWNHSFGGTVLRIDSAGHVRWNHINFDLPATYSLEVFPAGDTQGQTVPVKADQNPLTIRPVAGRATSGTVMDGDTGKPVPGALMRLNPATYGDGRYGGTIEVTTDNQGRFQIDCLDGGQYSVYGEQFLWDGSGLKVTGGAQDQVLTVKLRPERN